MPTDVRDRRDWMVDVHIAGRGIRDRRLLAAMRQVPREAFVDTGLEEFAYEDSPLPIAEEQTISQPYIVALMIEAAEIGDSDRVLEVGAGSGYAAAIAAQLARQVCAIERHASLVSQAARRFRRLGYSNIELRQGDGTLGWPDGGQFDVILVAASGERIPSALKQQLKIGGRLVILVGRTDDAQGLVKLTKRNENDFVLPASSTGCGPTMTCDRRISALAFTGSISTTCRLRSRPCWSTSTRSIRTLPPSPASATVV